MPRQIKIDHELLRMNALKNRCEDLWDCVRKFEKDFGRSSSKRARAYIKSRYGWLFNHINNTDD